MKIKLFSVLLVIAILFIIVLNYALDEEDKAETFATEDAANRAFDDTSKNAWDESFQQIEISSRVDGHIQKAYFYEASAGAPRPLVVSLHTWSGSYRQKDEIAELSRKLDVHYLHPDFRGPNNSIDACCSEKALQDIDDAIEWAISHSNVDTTKIYVIGVSGGGYATIGYFMRSRHSIKRYAAWASIADLVNWFHESRIRNPKYANDILRCTGSDTVVLNEVSAKQRSPIYWQTPVSKFQSSELFLYAGIHDGVTGSVPITHSIRFYNKLLHDLGVKDSSKYVSAAEEKALLDTRQPLGNLGTIGGRRICLEKAHDNIKLVIFDGGHEMLTEFAFRELVE